MTLLRVADPGSSYLTGCLEIVRIREAFFEAHGSRDTDALRAFHDGITSSGGLPIALAERAVLDGCLSAE